MSETTKFCKDCVHRKRFLDLPPECALTGKLDPVTGRQYYSYCYATRLSSIGICGPEAKLFKPKTPKLKWLKFFFTHKNENSSFI